MSYDQGSGGDGKAILNNLVTNAAAMLLYDKVLSGFLPKTENEYLQILMSAGVITTVEEVNAILARAGYDLTLFK